MGYGSMQVQEVIVLYEVGGNFVIPSCFPFNLNRIYSLRPILFARMQFKKNPTITGSMALLDC